VSLLEDGVFPLALSPRGNHGASIRNSIAVAGLGLNIGARGGITYIHSRHALRSMGMSSGYSTAGAIALTALDLVYVEWLMCCLKWEQISHRILVCHGS
jgi:hypothetical protein